MKKLFYLLSIISLVVLSSCKEEDYFHTQNGEEYREYYTQELKKEFRKNFENTFGTIASNQSWDLTTNGKFYGTESAASGTRAAGTRAMQTGDWYYVQNETLGWLQEELPDGTNHSNLGSSFIMTVPSNSFTIVPIFQGKGGLKFDLHMVVGDEDIKVWSKSQYVQVMAPSKGIEWDFVPLQISNYVKGAYNAPIFLNNAGITEWWGPDFAEVTYTTGKNTRTLLYCLQDNGGYLHVDNKGNLSLTSDVASASTFSYENQRIKIGDYYLYYDDGKLKTSKTLLANIFNQNSYRWSVTANGSANTEWYSWISQDKFGYTWQNLPGKTDDQTEDAMAVRALQYTFSDFPVGERMYFYLEITEGGNTTYATNGTKQSSMSEPKTMMLALNSCPRPSNIDSRNEVMIIACEDANLKGSDWDYNDMVFMVIGNPDVPKPVVIEDNTTIVTYKKRYMIEDLGSTDDFDYNDVVVDVEAQRYHHFTTKNGVIIKEEEGDWLGNGTATIRAMGGTLDFILQIGGSSFGIGGTQWKKSDHKQPFAMFNTGTPTGQLDDKGHNIYNGNGIDYNANLANFYFTDFNFDQNNVWIKVFPNRRNTSESSNSQDYNGNVTAEESFSILSGFPIPGDTPYIIAVDVDDRWMIERHLFEPLRSKIEAWQRKNQ